MLTRVIRSFIAYLLLFNPCHGRDGYTYPQEIITYAGITISCDKGCGTYDNPDLLGLWWTLEYAVKETFRHVYAFDERGDTEFLRFPVDCNDIGEYRRWDWKAANGIWPYDKSLICYTEGWVKDYSNFLKIASLLREDVYFYYFSVPKMIREFEINLIPKLEEGLKQGYNTYKVLPGGSVEFGFQDTNPLYSVLDRDARWIKSHLDYLCYYGFRHSKSVSLQNQAYKKAEDLIERAITDIDRLFRNIFAYCLKHHQLEGIVFSSIVEALLAGNLTEGIERIRALIDIGESQQFHPDLMGKMHLLKGQLETESSLYADAVLSLTEAIAKNPSLKEVYLERGIAYFKLSQYDRSMEDYLAYIDQIQGESTFSIADFSCAFAKNLPSGAYESGKNLGLFLSDLVRHPIHTAKQIWESLSLLSKLAVTKEWEELSQALAPEIHQLVVEWDHLSSEKRGELAGYAFGKYGADLLIPGALAKIGKKLSCGTEVNAAYKSLRAADQCLLLESMADCKSVTKFTESIETAQRTVFLGEELGFSAKEMGQLKQIGKLEITLQNEFNHLSLPKQESIDLFAKAEKSLRGHNGFKPEHEVRNLIHKTGIPTFPRPNGIPENYRVKLSNNGAGMKYVHLRDEGTYVRVMPGKAHSNYPCQQKPYVNHRINGQSVNKFGEKVPNDSIESHISLEEFIYRDFIYE